MKKKQQKQFIEEKTFRYKFIKMFSIHQRSETISLDFIQQLLEILNYLQYLKIFVDYFQDRWDQTWYMPVFIHLDPVYVIVKYLQISSVHLTLFLIIFLNTYWIFNLCLYLMHVQFNLFLLNLRKIMFIVFKNIFIPSILCNVIGLIKCQTIFYNYYCLSDFDIKYQIIYFLSFLLFIFTIGFQMLFNYQFLPQNSRHVNISFGSNNQIIFIVFAFLCQISHTILRNTNKQILFLNILVIMLAISVFLIKQKQDINSLLIQKAYIITLVSTIILLDVQFIFSIKIQIYTYFLLLLFIISSSLKSKTFDLQFQLGNINKWPTSQIMIKYAKTILNFINHKKYYLYRINLHGYNQIHRQKCDNPTCPTRSKLQDYDILSLKKQGNIFDQQLIRVGNVVKKIFSDGYKLTPISPNLMLQNSLFLYSRGDYELSLKNLLLIQTKYLTLQQYYVHVTLKRILCDILNKNDSKKNQLDFISQMQVKNMQKKLHELFFASAFSTIQFWGAFSDEHPDYQKVNMMAIQKLQKSDQIRKMFLKLSYLAYSQIMANLYSIYMQLIQNDEQSSDKIMKKITKQYNLQEKIKIQDWSNSSKNILMVSMDEKQFGTIIDMSKCCATVFGYEKHELVKQSVKILFLQKIHNQIIKFLTSEDQSTKFYLLQKSGYNVGLTRRKYIYNSFQTGLISFLQLDIQRSSLVCKLLVDQYGKIIGATSSIVSLLRIQFKQLQKQIYLKNIFNVNFSELRSIKQNYRFRYSDLMKEYCPSQGLKFNSKGYYSIKMQQRQQIMVFILQKCEYQLKQHETILKIENDFEFMAKVRQNCMIYFGRKQLKQQEVNSIFKYIITTQDLKIPQDTNLLYKQQIQKIDYSKGITSCRLVNNIIQIINLQQQKSQEQFNQKFQKNQQSQSYFINKIDEEQIYENKQSFNNFISKYKIGNCFIIFITITAIIIICFYILFKQISSNNIVKMQKYSIEAVYQNLILSTLSRSLLLIKLSKMYAINKTNIDYSTIYHYYKDNLDFLEQIYLNGSASQKIQLNSSFVTTDQFLLNYIQYGKQYYNSLYSVTSPDTMKKMLQNIQVYKLNYLQNNNLLFINQLSILWQMRQAQIDKIYQNYLLINFIFLISLLSFIILMTVIYILIIFRLQKQINQIFDIFLQINSNQIQQFSSKAQYFISLLQDQNNQENNQQKKQVSSNFNKKKTFHFIHPNYNIIFKIIFYTLTFSCFYIHYYVVSNTNIIFQKQAIQFIRTTASFNYNVSIQLLNIYAPLSQNNNRLPVELYTQKRIRSFYRNYLNLQMSIYANSALQYHEAWIKLQFGEICEQTSTFFANMADIWYLPNSQRQSVIPQILRVSSSKLIFSWQQCLKFINISVFGLFKPNIKNDWTIVLLWSLLSLIMTILWAFPIVHNYTIKLNYIKQIITILPLSWIKKSKTGACYVSYLINKTK